MNPPTELSNYPDDYEDSEIENTWLESSSGDPFTVTLARRTRNSILSIQKILGTNPEGGSETVDERILSLESGKSDLLHNHDLTNLEDVIVTSLSNGDILEWDSVLSKFKNVSKPNSAIWGSITGTLFDQTDLQNALNAKANTSHTHTIANITGLQSELNNKASLTQENLFYVDSHEKIKIADDYLEVYGVFDNPIDGFPSVQVSYRALSLLVGLDHTKGTIQNQLNAIATGGISGGTIAYIDKTNTFSLIQRFSNADRHLSSDSGTNLFDFNIHDGSPAWDHDPIGDPNLNKDGSFRFGANTNTGSKVLSSVWFKGDGTDTAVMQLIHSRGILALLGSHYAYGFISYAGQTSMLGQAESWTGHNLCVNDFEVLSIMPKVDGLDPSGYKGGYLRFKGVLHNAIAYLYFDTLAGYESRFRFTNNISAPVFEGSGAQLTNLNANNITSGTLSISRGGTGATSGTNNGVAYYSTTGPRINYTSAGTVNQVLLGSSGVPSFGQVSNNHISSSAAIVDTKLATIATAGKVSDTALSNNVALYNRTTTFTVNQTFNQNIFVNGSIYSNRDGLVASQDAFYYFGNVNTHYLRWFSSEQLFQFTHDLKIGDGTGKIIASGEMINKVANSLKVEHIPVTNTILTNKYINLEQYVLIQSNFVLMVSGGPAQVIGIDYILQETGGTGTGFNRVNWSGLGLDGPLTTEATLIIIYQPGLTIMPSGFLEYIAGTEEEPFYVGGLVEVQ